MAVVSSRMTKEHQQHTGWINENKNHATHMLQLSQSPDLKQIEHLLEILDRCD